MEVALDDGCVADDLAADVEDEMGPADAVQPVVLGEALLLVVPERGREDRADGRDLGRRQLRRRELAQARSVRFDIDIPGHGRSLALARSSSKSTTGSVDVA